MTDYPSTRQLNEAIGITDSRLFLGDMAAANQLAGTSGLEVLGALNVAAGRERGNWVDIKQAFAEATGGGGAGGGGGNTGPEGLAADGFNTDGPIEARESSSGHTWFANLGTLYTTQTLDGVMRGGDGDRLHGRLSSKVGAADLPFTARATFTIPDQDGKFDLLLGLVASDGKGPMVRVLRGSATGNAVMYLGGVTSTTGDRPSGTPSPNSATSLSLGVPTPGEHTIEVFYSRPSLTVKFDAVSLGPNSIAGVQSATNTGYDLEVFSLGPNDGYQDITVDSVVFNPTA